MIYLIGGMPRVGKSMLAKTLLERNGVSWMPLDTIRDMLHNAIPQLGIKEGESWWDTHQEKFFPFLRELVHESETSFTFEGDSFLPRHAAELAAHPDVRACFLGVSRMSVAILKEKPGLDDWVKELPPEELSRLPGWIVTKSLEYEAECRQRGIRYFDVSGPNRAAEMEKAYKYLISGA